MVRKGKGGMKSRWTAVHLGRKKKDVKKLTQMIKRGDGLVNWS